jgi:hypothetical protein
MTVEQETVTVDRDLADLIPGFMERRREDVARLRKLLACGDMGQIRMCGHSMKGTGSGYGFGEISAIGSEIEQAAVAGEDGRISELADRLEAYLDKVVIRFN